MNETSALKLLSKELLPGTVYDYCLPFMIIVFSRIVSFSLDSR